MSRSAARRSGATRQERQPKPDGGGEAGPRTEAVELTLVEGTPVGEERPIGAAKPIEEAVQAVEAVPTEGPVPTQEATTTGTPTAAGTPTEEEAARDAAAAEVANAEPEVRAELEESPVQAEAEVEVASPVNYDDEGLGEVEIDGLVYRFDSGKQGTALCLSLRREGAWRWSYLGELRWDGRDLRSKALDRSLLTRLSASLRTLAEQTN